MASQAENPSENTPLVESIESGTPKLKSVYSQHATTVPINMVLLGSCACASLTGMSLGFDIGVTSDAIDDIAKDWNLSFVDRELCVGILSFVAAFGALIALITVDSMGRRVTMAISSIFLICGAFFQGLAKNYEELMFGRILAGLGVGTGLVVSTMYISEISPAAGRGMLGSLLDINANFGVALGFFIGYTCGVQFSTDQSWRIMICLGSIPPFISLISVYFIPESPRWLIMTERPGEAKRALSQLGDLNIDYTLQAIVDEHNESKAFEGILFDKTTRRALLIAAGLGIMQQISGTEAILYYTPKFLIDAGMSNGFRQMMGEVIIALSRLFINLFMALKVDSSGRRVLLIKSAIGVTIALFTLIFTFSVDGKPWVIILFVGLYMLCYAAGQGLVTFLVATEILPTHVRAQGMALTTLVNRLTAGIISTTALTFVQKMGYSGFFSFYFLLSITPIMFYVAMAPETSRKTLEELSANFRLEIQMEKQEKEKAKSGLNFD